MRIAYDVTPTCHRHRSGVARYAVDLAEALVAAGEQVEPWCRLSRWRKRGWCHRPGGAAIRWYQEGLWPWRCGAEVVHGTDVRVPGWGPCARVATIHDVFHCLPMAVGWSSPAFAARARVHYVQSAARAHLLVAVSEATRQDVIAHLGVDPARIVAVPHGIDGRFAPQSPEAVAAARSALGLPEGYLLYVGAIAIRKNLPALVRAYAASTLRGRLPLVLAGGASDASAAVAEAVRACALGDLVRVVDFVPDAHLPGLYAGAAAVCLPSLYEGFGLPVLEAMACGAPVFTSDRGALAEVAGGHAVTADPDSVEAMAAALPRALDLSAAARARAQAHARTFTWARCAQGHLAAYRRAIELRG
jgi:glycosyltransferase involved in cell wall biosynthesis